MRYRTKEFIVATEYKPKLGKLYYVGADGNIYETTMGPKSKGYKAPMVVELNSNEKKMVVCINEIQDVVYDIVENEKKQGILKNLFGGMALSRIFRIWYFGYDQRRNS